MEKREEEDAFVRGEMESGVMGDAAMVPGAESIFCEVSRSTSMGVLPNLTAVVGHGTRVTVKGLCEGNDEERHAERKLYIHSILESLLF